MLIDKIMNAQFSNIEGFVMSYKAEITSSAGHIKIL